MKKTLSQFNKSNPKSSTQEIIEETPVKEEDTENDSTSSDKMMRDIQRLSLRLRSSIPCKTSFYHN